MEGFSFFDIAIVLLTLFLGLKGLMRGFIKEFFGLVGIIGGVFFASRISDDIGNMITRVVTIENEATKSMIGFVLAFVAIWFISYTIGILVAKISSMSGLGVVDRILGFIFGAAKIFFIFAIIIYALSKIETIKAKLDDKLTDSIMYPILQEVGNTIIKLDTNKIAQKIEKNIETNVEDIKEDISTDLVDKAKEEITQQLEKAKEVGEK